MNDIFNKQDDHISDLPPTLAAPAKRASASINCSTLSQLAHFRESEILALHGIGPRAMGELRRYMGIKGIKLLPD